MTVPSLDLDQAPFAIAISVKYKPMVYIVDPDNAHCNAIASLFDRLGSRSIIFHSGEDLLEQMAHQRIDGCVLSEINLPGMSGLELLDELRAQNASVPFIILTADPEVKLAVAAFHQNVSGYLIKPVAERELAKSVERALKISNAEESSMH